MTEILKDLNWLSEYLLVACYWNKPKVVKSGNNHEKGEQNRVLIFERCKATRIQIFAKYTCN